MNNTINLLEKKTVNTKLDFNNNTIDIAYKYVTARRKYATKGLKSDDNTIALNFLNTLINMLKSADITLNDTSDIFTLKDNKISGKNKTDLKSSEVCKAIDKILETGRYNKIIDNKEKTLFLKGVKYYHIEKKEFYEFKDKDQWKAIEKDFKKWSLQYIKLQGFIIDLTAKKVYKDQK